MAIRVPQTGVSQVDAAKLPGIGPAPLQNAPLDLTNTAAANILKAAAGATQTAGLLFAKEQKDRLEAQQAADILDESTKYFEATRAFEKGYEDSAKGADARGAVGVYQKFHQDQLSERSARFAGDPRLALLWQRHASQIQQSSIMRGQGYAEKQDAIYRDDTTKARISLFYQKAAEVGEDDVAVHKLRTQLNGEITSLNPGRDLTAIMDEVDRTTALTRINAAIAVKNAPEAERLLGEYKGVLGKSYDEALHSVESAKSVARKEAGVDFALQLFQGGVEPQEAWKRISKLGDKDEMQAAQSQYSTLQTMKMKIDEEMYQDGAIAMRDQIDSMAPTDLAGAERMVLGLPEESKTERRVKVFAEARLNEWKRGSGIDALSDSEAFLGIRSDILSGRLNTREQILADPRAVKVTKHDLDGDSGLVKMLDAGQKLTDKAVDDAFEHSFGAKQWANMKSKQKDVVMEYVTRVREQVRQTNRGQDTDYIQKITDVLALRGVTPSRFDAVTKLKNYFGADETLAESLRTGATTLPDVASNLAAGKSTWLPSKTPDSFEATWMNPNEVDQASWEKLYGKDAKRAAYLGWTLQQIGPRR